jgi:hypothetical protein
MNDGKQVDQDGDTIEDGQRKQSSCYSIRCTEHEVMDQCEQ